MPAIYVIILNWNGYKDTVECINSISNITYKNIRIVVVDNGSDTNEINNLIINFPEVKLLKSEKNLGFSGGNNLGIYYSLKANAEYILLLNNDTIVQPNFLDPLIQIFESNNESGIAAPQINYYKERNRIWTSGGKISRIKGSGFAYSDKIEDNQVKGLKQVNFVSGCCMLIKREVFDKVGLFDEKYFLYVEDTDFCFRTIKAGYKIIVSHDSKIYHKIGNSTANNFNVLQFYYTTRNRLYFAKKNFHSTYLITVTYIFFAMLLKSYWWFCTGRGNLINSIKWAFRDFFKSNMGKTDQKKFGVK